MLTRLVYLASVIISVMGCVATSGAGTPSTSGGSGSGTGTGSSTSSTAAPGTTTTTSAPVVTTTTTAGPCMSCTVEQITYSSKISNNIISTGTLQTNSTTGCLQLVASCTADTGYYPEMFFNPLTEFILGPAATGQTAQAILDCVNGNWTYTGVPDAVILVACKEIPNP